MSSGYAKGQFILKCLFGVFTFCKKTNKNKLTWGIIVVKSNSFVCFLREMSAWKNHFDFFWPLDTVIIFGQDLEISATVFSQMKLKATDEAADLVGPFHVHLLKGCPNVLVHLFFLFLFLILPQSFRFIRESMTRRAKLCQFVWTSPRQKTQPTNSRLWLKLKLEHVRWLKGLIENPKNINQICSCGQERLCHEQKTKGLGALKRLWKEEQYFVNSYERLQDRKLSQPTHGSDWSWS